MQRRSIYIDIQCLGQKGKKNYDYIESNKIYFVLILCPSFRKAVEHFQVWIASSSYLMENRTQLKLTLHGIRCQWLAPSAELFQTLVGWAPRWPPCHAG